MSLRTFMLPALAAGIVAAGPSTPQGAGVPSGAWVVASSEQDGKPFEFPAKGTRYTFADGKVTVGPEAGTGKVVYTFRADSKKDPKEIDLVQEGGKRKVVLRGIYREEKGRLIICVGLASGSGDDTVVEGDRPTAFKSGPNAQLLTFEPSGK